jgi:multidrug efflux pump subunit AcrA (membrane-fusion protein)
MNPIAKLATVTAAVVIAITGVFAAVAFAVSPAKGLSTATAQSADISSTQTTVETLDPPATDEETAAFYSELAPRVGQVSGSAKLIAVKQYSTGCYGYTWSNAPDHSVIGCIDVSTEGFNAWVIEYRKTH